jgi:hypothetical protein
MKSDFFDMLSKHIHISNFMKIMPVGFNLLHAEGWTDGETDGWIDRYDEATNIFSQFWERA